jgi:hypothetical protein
MLLCELGFAMDQHSRKYIIPVGEKKGIFLVSLKTPNTEILLRHEDYM